MLDESDIQLQLRVSRMLGYGFAFSIVWLGGFGSLTALLIGFRARSIIKSSRGELRGLKMAWWCIIVGAVGVGIVLPYTIELIYKAFDE